MPPHNAIRSQCSILFLVAFLCASCPLITSSFAAIACKPSASIAMAPSPSRVLTGVSSASDREINKSASGTDSPCSHLETVCRTTFSLTASSCWESPFDFLIAFIVSLSIQDRPFLSVVTTIVSGTARCRKQRLLTFRKTAAPVSCGHRQWNHAIAFPAPARPPAGSMGPPRKNTRGPARQGRGCPACPPVRRRSGACRSR